MAEKLFHIRRSKPTKILKEEKLRKTDGGGVPLAPVLARYTEVGLRYKAEKVRDYSAEQDLLWYTLD